MDARKNIDPELRDVIEHLPPQFDEIRRDNLHEVRAIMGQMKLDLAQPDAAVHSERRQIPGTDGDVTVVIAQRQGLPADRPCVLWIHGGGYIMGDADDPVSSVIAARFDCTVVSVDYRLAPEYPFPAGPRDCHDALLWVAQNSASLGIDPDQIIIGGASAGGGMAAGVALMNRDLQGPPLAFQFLVYPMLDNLHDTASGQLENNALWNRRTSVNAWEMYLDGAPGKEASPYAAAARAPDLSGLPPAYVVVGGEDLFRDDCIGYAQRLMASGVATQLAVFPGVFHGAEMLVPDAAISQRMQASMFDALGNALARASAG
tara:strand:- start:97319 stop:98269 length:951 start_codon:yes stop_codon:yes gene_type:complete